MPNIGRTSFFEDIIKDTSFDDFEKIFEDKTFKDDENKVVSKRDAFKQMGGTYKPKSNGNKKEED